MVDLTVELLPVYGTSIQLNFAKKTVKRVDSATGGSHSSSGKKAILPSPPFRYHPSTIRAGTGQRSAGPAITSGRVIK
jgi:hypothetical protein